MAVLKAGKRHHTSKYVYKSHREQGTVLGRNCTSGANLHAFPHIPRCMTYERKTGKQEAEASAFELEEEDWDVLANVRPDKLQRVFSSRSANPVLGLHHTRGS